MTDILRKILATKREEIAAQKAAVDLAHMQKLARQAPAVRDFVAALRRKHAQNQPAIIAEIKKASPSKGLIRADFQPAAHAVAYENAGAACLSVLTDEPYFQGSPNYLRQAREAVSLPVLRKDFMLDEYQIYQARAWGADAELRHLEQVAHDLGMAVLLELHDEAEAERCAPLTTPLRGVNNRNLRTFEVDLQQTIRLLPYLSDNALVITESGITGKDDIRFMQQHGVNSFLIGETFMRAPDIEAAVRQLF